MREIGRELGLPPEFLDRHPFPGPGLAIRCLCTETGGLARRGVGLDCTRSARSACRAIRGPTGTFWRSKSFPTPEARLQDRATALVNDLRDINRVIALTGTHAALAECEYGAQR